MTHIPSLTHQQLDLLRLAKQHSSEVVRLTYEFPVIDQKEPPITHPSFIQGLIDVHLIQVQVKETSFSASVFQQESWKDFCEDIKYPSQEDWELWRKEFIAQQAEAFDYLMTPGKELDQFSLVWIREMGLRTIQPGNL